MVPPWGLRYGWCGPAHGLADRLVRALTLTNRPSATWKDSARSNDRTDIVGISNPAAMLRLAGAVVGE
jgi:hypothetical protein